MVALHFIGKENHVFKMSARNEPRLRVKSGDIIIVETEDGFGGVIKSDLDPFPKIDFDRVNQATGPIYVEDAEQNDTLIVDILDIEVADRGVVTIIPGFGALSNIFKKEYKRVLPIRDGFILFSNRVRIPVKPVIGTIGVAPFEREITTLYPGPHGGNMDVADITKGSRVYFPVFVKGALLALGDAKASMGDGESNGVGVEVATKTTIRVNVIKGYSIKRPRVENEDEIMTIASAKSLEEACKLALMDMISLIKERADMSDEEAYTLLGAAADVRIANIVDPEVTVRVSIKKSFLL